MAAPVSASVRLTVRSSFFRIRAQPNPVRPSAQSSRVTGTMETGWRVSFSRAGRISQ
ncbi:MAG: hypothetical protein ABSG19_00920 [Candidatus Aminicenantales bacterium]